MLPSPPATIAIRLITNANRSERGWPIDSEFVERFWLPAVGPSCIALLRHAARTLDDRYRIR